MGEKEYGISGHFFQGFIFLKVETLLNNAFKGATWLLRVVWLFFCKNRFAWLLCDKVT